uniref:DNA replication ATP-dependent helicase/nuclease n=1 Tax=Romanomermis culicivorax TaxID=13658 RepID=A0A915IDH6_ROMCU
KTFCIVTLIEIFYNLGQTILLTSYTNSAVDNILRRLSKEFTLGKILRIGPSVDKSSSKFTLAEHLKQGLTIKEAYEQIPIVAATSSTVSSHPLFANRRFDVAIVDEATQVQELLSISPLLCCSKFILVGDSKQLNPLITSKLCRAEGMAESLFSKFESAHPASVTTLNEQFRMNK